MTSTSTNSTIRTVDKSTLTKQQLKRLEQFAEITRIITGAQKRTREWARDLRTDYPAGENGDAQFLSFITDVMGHKHEVARAFLTFAMVTRMFPNDREYDRVIGVDTPKCAIAKLNIVALSKLPLGQQETLISKHKRGGANDLRRALRALSKEPTARRNLGPTSYQIAKCLDEHWEALEASGIPLQMFSEFINAQLNREGKVDGTDVADNANVVVTTKRAAKGE